ncbi:MAG: hypothetical protein GEU74_01340 [Nitriliruptorales bacterium]|nr:hypothetical protein [Nitriliruptorales bacterium]
MTTPQHLVIVFLSTGRCGTQSLATHLGEVYSDLAVVAHEPIGPDYRCREFFRAYDGVHAMSGDPVIAAHLSHIDCVARHRTYVETGWPLFSAIPLFVDRFGERLRIVHLTRHPVPTAISHMVHKTYAGSPRVDGYTKLAALDPWCDGIFQREARGRWDHMTPFEKTLFWWTEVHLYAEEVAARYPQVPFHRVKAEELLSGNPEPLRALCGFLQLPFRAVLTERMTRPVDQWRHRTEMEFDWRRALEHPQTLAVTERLGYRMKDVDDAALADRYSR